MKNISIKGKQRTDERRFRLVNGSLILQCDGNGRVLDSFIVTSYRNNKGKQHWENTANYCSLVNLDTGKLAFEEPSSRGTTEFRILRHLKRCCQNAGLSDYYYDDSKIGDQYIKVYENGNYSIEITLGNEKI